MSNVSSKIRFLLGLSIFSVIAIGVFSGLSNSVTVPLFMLVLWVSILNAKISHKKEGYDDPNDWHYYGQNYSIKNIIFATLQRYKLETALFSFLLLNSFYSINPSFSLKTSLKLLLFYLSSLYLTSNLALVEKDNLKKPLTVSFLTGIAILFLEINYHGLISEYFREIFQQEKEAVFALYNLDRGCSLIALVLWVMVVILRQMGQNFIALLMFCSTTALIGISDSLSSFVALISSAVIYLLVRYLGIFRNSYILSGCFIISVILMCFGSFKIHTSFDIKTILDQLDFLPFSAKHRLFIWDYVAGIYQQSPWVGIGIGSTKFYSVPESHFLSYHGQIMSPLPMHPHNVVLQIFLEMGAVGALIVILIICKYIFNLSKICGGYGDDLNPHDDIYNKEILACYFGLISCIYVISMISYNFWQSWWQSSIFFSMICFSLISKQYHLQSPKKSNTVQ